MTQQLEIGHQKFVLHYSGAAYWENQKILLIADVHLGKVMHFRKNGIAVPEAALTKNFEELKNVLTFFEPEKVFFLGDLFHSGQNSEWALFEDWCGKCKAQITLIAGNHDIIQQKHYDRIGVFVVNEIIMEDFLLTHIPCERPGYFIISGHVHPGIKLKGTGRQFLNLPCFLKTNKQFILPAFGAFTGKHILYPREEDVVYIIANKEVMLH